MCQLRVRYTAAQHQTPAQPTKLPKWPTTDTHALTNQQTQLIHKVAPFLHILTVSHIGPARTTSKQKQRRNKLIATKLAEVFGLYKIAPKPTKPISARYRK